MDLVNEQSTYILTLSFLDTTGQPVVFQTARYRIDDDKSGTNIKPWTAITPNGTATVDIEVEHSLNYIVNENLTGEIRTVTVNFTYGLTGEGYAVHNYQIQNLAHVIKPVTP
jgi:hypothetical protein